MAIRRLLTTTVATAGLLIAFPIHGEAQTLSPLFERAVTKAVTATQAPRPRPKPKRDSLVNGAVIGTAVGAVLGIAMVHATRDSELTAAQYLGGALIFGGIGAGVGAGVDALLDRGPQVVPNSPRRVALHTKVSPKSAGLGLVLRW